MHSAEEVVCTADEDLVARVMQITGTWPPASITCSSSCGHTHAAYMQGWGSVL